MTYKRPGVYITERLLPAPIAAANTAVAAGAAFGVFEQGPESITRVTSWYDFSKLFGGYNLRYPATFSIAQFFRNGGTELFIKRVVWANATPASGEIVDFQSNPVVEVTSLNRGNDGNLLRVSLVPVTGRPGFYDFTVYRETGVDAGSILDDEILEQFTGVVIDDADSDDFIETVVNEVSQYISVEVQSGTLVPTSNLVPLTGGSDGSTPTWVEILDEESPTYEEDVANNAFILSLFSDVIESFETVNRNLVIFAPELHPVLGESATIEIQNRMIAWAEENDSFAVLDVPNDKSVDEVLEYATAVGGSSSSAVYYPNVFVSNPVGRASNSLRKIGASGPVSGLFLSVDRDSGPFQAPAGITRPLSGVIAPERTLSSDELDDLNSSAFPVNAIRAIPGAGTAVMGARTLKQDGTANKYVNTRRSLNYLRKQIQEIAQLALFQPNNSRLWSQLRTSIAVFLEEYRNQGGLRGADAASAYYIKVDRENNTPQSIAEGRVNLEVGVALEYPAEFIVITLSQQTGI
jgi:phage tail sheath protein FI